MNVWCGEKQDWQFCRILDLDLKTDCNQHALWWTTGLRILQNPWFMLMGKNHECMKCAAATYWSSAPSDPAWGLRIENDSCAILNLGGLGLGCYEFKKNSVSNVCWAPWWVYNSGEFLLIQMDGEKIVGCWFQRCCHFMLVLSSYLWCWFCFISRK